MHMNIYALSIGTKGLRSVTVDDIAQISSNFFGILRYFAFLGGLYTN